MLALLWLSSCLWQGGNNQKWMLESGKYSIKQYYKMNNSGIHWVNALDVNFSPEQAQWNLSKLLNKIYIHTLGWKCLWISEKGERKVKYFSCNHKNKKLNSCFVRNAGDDLFSGEQRWPLGIVNVIGWLQKCGTKLQVRKFSEPGRGAAKQQLFRQCQLHNFVLLRFMMISIVFECAAKAAPEKQTKTSADLKTF